MAEKYLEGYLLLRRRQPRRIHHLDVLLEHCIELYDPFRGLVDDADFLKRYYPESRYPDDLLEHVASEDSA